MKNLSKISVLCTLLCTLTFNNGYSNNKYNSEKELKNEFQIMNNFKGLNKGKADNKFLKETKALNKDEDDNEFLKEIDYKIGELSNGRYWPFFSLYKKISMKDINRIYLLLQKVFDKDNSMKIKYVFNHIKRVLEEQDTYLQEGNNKTFSKNDMKNIVHELAMRFELDTLKEISNVYNSKEYVIDNQNKIELNSQDRDENEIQKAGELNIDRVERPENVIEAIDEIGIHEQERPYNVPEQIDQISLSGSDNLKVELEKTKQELERTKNELYETKKYEHLINNFKTMLDNENMNRTE